ncbi:MAG: hypothetical protein AAF362_04020 [Pseudomonadota bacterium]
MKKFVAALGVAGLVTAGGISVASAQNPVMNAMQCTAACNSSYGQCLSGGTDVMIASSPQEGVAKLQSNTQNTISCNQMVSQCYASCG